MPKVKYYTHVDVLLAEYAGRHVREGDVHHFVVVRGVWAGHLQLVVVVTCAELYSVHHHQELSHTG